MGILDKVSGIAAVTAGAPRIPMSEEQILACKTAIANKGLGYNVYPNTDDVNKPYRVAMKYNGQWNSFGSYTNADTAAAISALVSLSYFGPEMARAGNFDQATAEADPEFQAFLKEGKYQGVIARVNGDLPTVHANAQRIKAATQAADTMPF